MMMILRWWSRIPEDLQFDYNPGVDDVMDQLQSDYNHSIEVEKEGKKGKQMG